LGVGRGRPNGGGRKGRVEAAGSPDHAKPGAFKRRGEETSKEKLLLKRKKKTKRQTGLERKWEEKKQNKPKTSKARGTCQKKGEGGFGKGEREIEQ